MNTPKQVEVRRETVVLPTYEPARPDPNPMFLEKRVYQGSSGRVYPIPVVDRISETLSEVAWDAVFLENEFLRVMILPALGGRIHRVEDKTNGYDVIYHQAVIKPALVGLAGPWVSGGIEFNWPQHHRPSTCMPADVAIENHENGSATAWMSEHDPMARMKGMHGVRLHPGRSLLELVVRAYNRTPDVQTFLWWANAGVRVHEYYQSFFPPDTTHVADHAKRATSAFPLCNGRYYGVDYGKRAQNGIPPEELPTRFVPPHAGPKPEGDPGGSPSPDYAPNDLSWYANIPVPTSYMSMGSQQDFFGGYDFESGAGIVHVADHHISPGKKQWTWGNHEFGYAWDRNLTEPAPTDGHGEYAPYIELMAGVYTDNQPDFSFLQPGETKTWSQYWYPIKDIGPVQNANIDAAVSLQIRGRIARVGISVTARQRDTVVILKREGRTIDERTQHLLPGRPLVFQVDVGADATRESLSVSLRSGDGRELIHCTPKPADDAVAPPPAAEPAPPSEVNSADELFIIGTHLEQYRHATRMPELYWQEAVRRDPGDSRCNLALGRWHLRRGEFANAEKHLRVSIARLTARNPNPYDGESYYQLGLCLRWQAFSRDLDCCKMEDAYAAFYKATWNHAWQPAAFHALAECDAIRKDWPKALNHLERALRVNADNLRARNLVVMVLRKLGQNEDAVEVLRETLELDPLDWWARHLAGEKLDCDTQVRLDLAFDYARAGFFEEGIAVLSGASPEQFSGTAPLVSYGRGWLSHLAGQESSATRHLGAASQEKMDYCFPARLEEMLALEYAIAANPGDARAPYYLGNLLYDRRRHREAIGCWERAVELEPGNAIAWRNQGIGSFNVLGDSERARACYDTAFTANPDDARLLYERDQLWKRTGESPEARMRELLAHSELVAMRDDLSIELCALYNQAGQPQKALALLTGRKFQPWEGGEGLVLGQYVRCNLALGRMALGTGEHEAAVNHFSAALIPPSNLGEARHLLANCSDIHYWLGCAYDALAGASNSSSSRTPAQDNAWREARAHWTKAAGFKGDFQEMSVRQYSEMTYYSGRSLECLGRQTEADGLFQALLDHAHQLARKPAEIDYFATSLPTMLLFDDDLGRRQNLTARFLEAQALHGLRRDNEALEKLREIMRIDPNNPFAVDFLRKIQPSTTGLPEPGVP